MPSQQGTSRFAIKAGIIGVVGLGLTIGLMILMLKLAISNLSSENSELTIPFVRFRKYVFTWISSVG